MILSDKKGQSLMEAMVAIAIITTGIFSVWALFLSNFSGEQEARSRTIAANLAREGAELVKNIRDSNWLRIDNGEEIMWNDGLRGGTAVIAEFLAGPVALDYETDSLADESARLFLNKDNGFYTRDSNGRPTSFRRLVSLTPLCCSDAIPADLQCDDYVFSADGSFSEDDPEQPDCEGKMVIGYRVESKVRWEIDKKSRELIVADELYNWR